MTNSSKVSVILDPKTNLLVNAYASRPSYGYVLLSQEVLTTANGAIRSSIRTTRYRGDVELLQKLFKTPGEKLTEGTIVKFESFEPFMEGQQPKMNPQKNMELILKDGNPVFMMYQYEEDTNAKDEWIASTPEVVETSVSDDIAAQ